MDHHIAGKPSRADMAALESLRSKLVPLAGNLKELQHSFWINPNVPPDWPAMQRSIASLSNLLTSIQDVLNKDDAQTETFRSLHPYPITPFNIETPEMAGLASVILRKKPDVTDEKWLFDRLAKAQEFAHVPSDWEIEPRRPAKEDDSNGDVGGDESHDSIMTTFKRQPGTLDEDQIAELWGTASDIMKEEMAKIGSGETSGTGDLSESGSEASSPEDTTMGGMEANKSEEVAKKEEQRPPPMPLEVLQKFMATGMVS